MMKLLTTLALIIPTIVFGQGGNDQYRFRANLPEEIYHFLDPGEMRALYSIRTDLNPFYLRGDFDGDAKQDYAISIVANDTGKKGILVYHTGTKKHYIIGAGEPLSDGKGGDDYRWMGAWKVYTKKPVGTGAGEAKRITLRGEAILAIKLESASGIIYWTGKDYRWYQQGD